MDVAAVFALWLMLPSSKDSWAIAKLQDQWSQVPIVGLSLVPANEPCPGASTPLTFTFHGTKSFCHLYDHIEMGDCREEEYGPAINGTRKTRKVGIESQVVSAREMKQFERSRVCVFRDPFGRSFLSIMDDAEYKRGGLDSYNFHLRFQDSIPNYIEATEAGRFKFTAKSYVDKENLGLRILDPIANLRFAYEETDHFKVS